jgi:SAM-dependent methyltransferase
VADLADGAGLPDEAFDCVVLTQTLHLVFDVHAAARTLHRVLKPGGVLLLTVPGISPVSTDEWASTWYWSFTRHSARRLFEGVFGAQAVEVGQHGNALAATAFLQGLAAQELPGRGLEVVDPQFPVTITVRAVRAVEG